MAEQIKPSDHLEISVEQEKIRSPSQISKATFSSSLGGNDDKNGKVLIDTIVIIVFIAILALVLAITPLIVIAPLSFMLTLYFIVHIVQVFRTDDDNKLSEFMGALARWLCICFLLIFINLLLCMLIFGVTPSLKHRKVHGVSITRWIGVLAIICVFLSYSMFTRYVLGCIRLKREHSEEKTPLYEGLIGANNSVFYLVALFSVTKVAPILKEHTILGLPTYKWIRMILLVVLGHHAIGIFTSSIAVALRTNYISKEGKDGLIAKDQGHTRTQRLLDCIKKITGLATSPEEWIKYVVYYAEGLRKSFNFLLTSLLVLLTWILYFGSRLNRSSSHTIRVSYEIGLWTFACILGSAFLWLVKTGIILSWEARVVHEKLHDQVSRAADQLYLIGIIAGGPKSDILGVWHGDDHKEDKEEQQRITSKDHSDQPADRQESDGATGEGETKANVDRAKSRARKILVWEENKGILHATRIMKMARYFMDAEQQLSRDCYLSEFVEDFCAKKKSQIEENRNLHGDVEDDYKLLEKRLTEDDYELLVKRLTENFFPK